MLDLTLTDAALNPQAGCTVCGIQEGPYAYQAAFRDEKGNGVYYCERCAGCVAAAFGWIPAGELDALRAEILELRERDAEREQRFTAYVNDTERVAERLADRVADRIGRAYELEPKA